VPADNAWHNIAWTYSPTNHNGATLLNVFLALHVVSNQPAAIIVDRFAMAPPPPKNIKATKGTYKDKIQVSWNGSSSATKYRVFRNTENTSYSATDISGDVIGTTFEDKTAEQGKFYYYWIKAGRENGWSAFSFCCNGFVYSELLNPGFELQGTDGAADPADWSSYNAYRSSEYSHSGNWSLKISDGGWNNVVQTYGYAGPLVRSSYRADQLAQTAKEL